MCFPKEPAAGAASQKKKEEERKEREEKEERGRGGKGRGRGEKERREEGERERREGKEKERGGGERGGKEGGEGKEEKKEEGGRRERKEKGERRKERRKERGRKGERKEEGKRKEGKKGWWIIPRRCTAVTGGRLTTAYYCPKPRACRFRNNRAADECSRIVPRPRSDFLQNGPVFLVAETGARRAPPPSERGVLSLSFNRRIRNMSVGRFQLALRALDLRAAPCPRGLLRPTGSVGGVTS